MHKNRSVEKKFEHVKLTDLECFSLKENEFESGKVNVIILFTAHLI